MKKILEEFEHPFLAIGMLLMLIIAFANVIARKLQIPLAFTEELTCALFIFVTLLGSAVAAKNGAHMGLSVLTDLLPKNIRRFVPLITMLAAWIFCGYLLVYGIAMVQSEMKFGQTTAALGWPEWWFGSFVPIGALFMLIRFTQFGIREFLKKEDKE